MIAKTLSRLGIEVWKDIPEYEGFYQVSNLGNVRSLNYKKNIPVIANGWLECLFFIVENT